ECPFPSPPRADVRRQETQHDRCDELLGQRGFDRASGSGAVSDARCPAPKSDSFQPGSVSDVRLVALAAQGGQDHGAFADKLSPEPDRSSITGIEGAPP